VSGCGLTAQTERLISEVKSYGDKIDELRHQATYIKDLIAASAVMVSLVIAVVGFILSAKGDAVLQAVRAVIKP
jgi:hypothetical protein